MSQNEPPWVAAALEARNSHANSAFLQEHALHIARLPKKRESAHSCHVFLSCAHELQSRMTDAPFRRGARRVNFVRRKKVFHFIRRPVDTRTNTANIFRHAGPAGAMMFEKCKKPSARRPAFPAATVSVSDRLPWPDLFHPAIINSRMAGPPGHPFASRRNPDESSGDRSYGCNAVSRRPRFAG